GLKPRSSRTTHFRTLRGYTLVAALCDEIAFWRSDESASPDSENHRRHPACHGDDPGGDAPLRLITLRAPWRPVGGLSRPGSAGIPAENRASDLKSLLHPILVPDQWQMLLCKLLKRAQIRIKRPGENLSFLGLCRNASIVFDEGNGRPFGLNARQ